LVWITFLALANKDGVVEGAVPGIAHMARVEVGDTIKAIEVLEEPDEYSRNSDYDGRRIEKVEGGWKILNYEVFRAKLSREDRKEYFRVKQAEYRAKVRGA
jgi:hypothetical protein